MSEDTDDEHGEVIRDESELETDEDDDVVLTHDG
jgi:hypothetical protein